MPARGIFGSLRMTKVYNGGPIGSPVLTWRRGAHTPAWPRFEVRQPQ